MRKLGSPPLTDRCFLCDRTSDQVVWRENGVVGRLCECGLLYADTGGKPLEVAEFTNQNHPESFYVLPARLKAGWMAARCPRGKLLEIGCGEASFLKAARELGYEVSGMEPHTARGTSGGETIGY